MKKNAFVIVMGLIMALPISAQSWNSWDTHRTISGVFGIANAAIESAEKAVREGSYTVTFEFINPDNNKVTAKGMLKNVKVNIGKDRSEATTSISTGDAELEVM